MKLLRPRRSDPEDSATSAAEQVKAPESTKPAATSGKGKPTPKRREAENRRRGPVAPAPLTGKEARARRKALRGDRKQRKESSAQRRTAAAERRALMMAGDERYLLPRDKGPVKRYVRDLVDARRNLAGLFMPTALLLMATLFAGPQLQNIVTLVMVVMMVLLIGEGLLLGRIVNKRVRERFPDSTERAIGLAWYAFVRASQLRMLRAPKPQVKPGQAV